MRKLIVSALLFLLCSSSSYAAIFDVTTTGDCTTSPPGIMCLREAILIANSNGVDDQINIPSGHYIFSQPGVNDDTGATGDLDLLDTITIIGEAPSTTIIDANFSDRVFHIPILSELDTEVTFTNLTIQNGQTNESTVSSSGEEHGAGLYNNRRTVTLNNVIIQNNNVIGEENSSVGGGLFNIGTMEMYDCTITNNDAQRGGGIFNAGTANLKLHRSTIHGNSARAGGGMTLYGTFTIQNSTIYNNTANPYSTGGLIVGADATGVIFFSTISKNRGNVTRGGIYLQEGSSIAILGSIISNNRIDTDNSLVNCFLSTPFASSAYNLEDGNTCGFSPPLNLINTNPKLGTLSRNEGLTQTLPLLSGSPAIDGVAAATGVTEDQRGKPRPKGQYSDIGAFEYYSLVCFPVSATNGNIVIICM